MRLVFNDHSFNNRLWVDEKLVLCFRKVSLSFVGSCGWGATSTLLFGDCAPRVYCTLYGPVAENLAPGPKHLVQPPFISLKL